MMTKDGKVRESVTKCACGLRATSIVGGVPTCNRGVKCPTAASQKALKTASRYR
jgi:hypothetical protein